MTEEELNDGITKARLVYNLTRNLEDQFVDNDSYSAWVCEMAGLTTLPESAVISYVEQHADKEIVDLEAELEEKNTSSQ
jgi:hypothetical protein